MTDPIRIANPDDDFELREEMIPMRDGVHLRTLVLTPKAVSEPLPILLLRTPYDAAKRLQFPHRPKLHSVLGPDLADLAPYIFVFQDVRGRHGSFGTFEINRPPRGEFNNADTDETTDAWDTVDWLVSRLDRCNGRVGLYGTSYEGWTVLMALLDPHPAVRSAVPVNPMVDCWRGDDWFHNGAFRQAYAFEYVYAMQSDSKHQTPFAFSYYDTFDWWLEAGSALELGQRYLDEGRHSFWKRLTENPDYSSYWQSIAADRLLRDSKAPLVPTLHVHGWFDQEDMYGAFAAFAAMNARDKSGDQIYLTAGPWYHGQSWLAGDRLGSLRWSEDAARRWRREQLAPFFAHYLHGAPAHGLPRLSAFNTGTHRWETFDSWPRPSDAKSTIYLAAGRGLSFQAPTSGEENAESYVSDPSQPIPAQPRPIHRIVGDETDPMAWRTSLGEDQRFVDGRPDVLSYRSKPLASPVTIRGPIGVRLFAQTTGSDADWVVKLIDCFADLEPSEPEMSGFQLMVSADIFRGRFRNSRAAPEALTAGDVLEYRFELPHANHTFRPGHRIMVQVQSTWFPLYDRNPQRFVANIMDAKPSDYQNATHRIHANRDYPSGLEVFLTGDGT
jgi:uncharacterized protein